MFQVFARVYPTASDKLKIGQVFSDTQNVTLDLPELKITSVSQLMKGATAQVHFRMVNPLRVPLTGIEVEAEGDGVLEKSVDMAIKNINSQETVTGV